MVYGRWGARLSGKIPLRIPHRHRFLYGIGSEKIADNIVEEIRHHGKNIFVVMSREAISEVIRRERRTRSVHRNSRAASSFVLQIQTSARSHTQVYFDPSETTRRARSCRKTEFGDDIVRSSPRGERQT